jgi:aerobic C4-dicarboxylate transport protein
VRGPLYKNLTVQVLTAVAIGVVVGYCWPSTGVALKPLGDGFIKLVKMVVAPIIFLTIVAGIAGMGDLKKVGRVGGKALLYFEVVTTIALFVGLLVVNVVKPGAGVPPPTHLIDKAAEFAAQGQKQTLVQFLLHTVPDNIVKAFAEGDLLQVLVFSVLFGVAVASLGVRGEPVIHVVHRLTEVMFRMVSLIMRVAPLGALGAIAYTVGEFGIQALVPLAKLMGCVYLTMALFIFVILGAICRFYGFSLWRYLVFIRHEIVLVLGTSSSESALPRMMEKLELLGCSRNVVGMVIPAGYSFNLDGTTIYLSMALLFIAQFLGVEMTIGQQLYAMIVLMLTSKGAAAVTGVGFITLAATLSTTHVLPSEGVVTGLALLLGVDRFMSEARAVTNLIGNGVATICVSKMEREFDPRKYDAAIHGHPAAVHTPEVTADIGAE